MISKWGKDLKSVRCNTSRKFLPELRSVIRGATLHSTAYCYAHGRECPLLDIPAGRDQHLLVHAAGSCCYDFSKVGSKLGFLGKSAAAFFFWLEDAARRCDDFLCHECVPGHPAKEDIERRMSATHVVLDVQLDPERLGLPLRRPRRYVLAVKRSHLVGAIPVSLSHAMLHEWGRSPTATGNVLFSTP